MIKKRRRSAALFPIPGYLSEDSRNFMAFVICGLPLRLMGVAISIQLKLPGKT